MSLSIRSSGFLFLRILSISLLLSSCAQMLPPNGGKTDDKPPRAVKYMPDSAAVNFKAKEINIVFNEYIQLKDVNNQLIVSPPLEEQPEIKLVKNRILNISLKKPLKENTTYTFNFGNSIADYNEGNVLDGFKYIFSTGPFIDSLSVSGKVQYAFDHKTEKGIMVMLYENPEDSAPFKTIPSYFTKTDAGGNFIIANLRKGEYKIFALKDENNNYKYDPGSEFFAFAGERVEAGTEKSVELSLFREFPEKLKLKTAAAAEYGHIVLVFNKPAEDLKIKALNVADIPVETAEFSKNKDSLHYWFEGVNLDSLKLQLIINGKIIDTARVKLISKEQAIKSAKGGKPKLSVASNAITGQKFDLKKDLILKFNHPIPVPPEHAEIKKYFLLYEDTVLKQDMQTVMSLQARYIFKLHIDRIDNENKKYKLFIPPQTFTDIFGFTNDTVKAEFVSQEEKYYGTLKLKLSLPAGTNYILQLLDSRENIVKEDLLNESKILNYDYLQPGTYKLKIIYDANGNGKWDTGNYLQKKQPEKVVYYNQPVIIRSNWDMETEWKP